MIMGVHHTAISTPDLERLKSFYCDLFGLEEVMRFGWEQGDELCDSIVGLDRSATNFVFLRSGNTHLEIFEYSHPTPKPREPQWRVCDYGITHICFEVADIHAEFHRLTKAGMRFQNEAPIDAMGMLHAVYGFDPDGNIVELIEFPDRERHSESSSLTGAPLLNGTNSLLSELS
ncbi:glyoxalase/bleomycin resistance/dioxygenase family protein [Mycolicibacterium sp. P9-64]|uniref:VOC family protein n=1 Tax=Mycolicibacterium sp. P9-64 TaxID=2024612 RepID=UPI0011EC707C|nr:VOC family protein [Mycolicibacterium sp. P9-64]KAA0086440.1 glyoxalase/bleomycin resistance/dioxygenase family protein [Mycolicibacterium sp. P9-64]